MVFGQFSMLPRPHGGAVLDLELEPLSNGKDGVGYCEANFAVWLPLINIVVLVLFKIITLKSNEMIWAKQFNLPQQHGLSKSTT